VKGKTTRAEVLQVEGTPDGQGDGADWFVYSSTSKQSGFGLFFCAAGGNNIGCGDVRRQVWDYRRLVVRFDAAGVVKDAHVDSASCLLWTRDFGTPLPCLDLRGDDLRREDALATVQEGKLLATYPSVRWPMDQENDCNFYGKLIVTQDALYLVADAGSPFNRRSDRVDPALCPEPESVVAFDYAEITDVALVTVDGNHQAIKLSRKDGSHLTYQFYVNQGDEGDGPADDTSTRADAPEIAEDIEKAAGKLPDSFGGLDTEAEGVPKTYGHIRWCSGWDPPTIPLLERQIPCERPKDGYLILTATGFMFQLADAGDGLSGLVSGEYADMRTVGIRDSGLFPSYSHWVVVETRDGQVDAFDPDDSDRKIEINGILQSHLPKVP
jgi:hypothetical protein